MLDAEGASGCQWAFPVCRSAATMAFSGKIPQLISLLRGNQQLISLPSSQGCLSRATHREKCVVFNTSGQPLGLLTGAKHWEEGWACGSFGDDFSCVTGARANTRAQKYLCKVCPLGLTGAELSQPPKHQQDMQTPRKRALNPAGMRENGSEGAFPSRVTCGTAPVRRPWPWATWPGSRLGRARS